MHTSPPRSGPDGLTERLRSHVETLAGEIGERNVWRGDGLARSAEWIRTVWEEQGFEVGRQAFESRGVECANLEVTVPGAERPDEIVLLGAHYDTVAGCPGANDNGTGVAALLEISRNLRDAECTRSLRFVAFANEEPPFFLTGDLGSRLYADTAPYRYPHYHRPTDTPDRIDYPSLAEVTRGLAGMARHLAT